MAEEKQGEQERFARWLHALAREVERDPQLAERIRREIETGENKAAPSTVESPSTAPRQRRRSSRYGPPTIAGRPPITGGDVPDPASFLATYGEERLKSMLGELRIGTLRAIIRTYQLDPDGKLSPQATEKRLVSAIVAAARRQRKQSTSAQETS